MKKCSPPMRSDLYIRRGVYDRSWGCCRAEAVYDRDRNTRCRQGLSASGYNKRQSRTIRGLCSAGWSVCAPQRLQKISAQPAG